jgi:tetratricopeptide (TPR) repeat protein
MKPTNKAKEVAKPAKRSISIEPAPVQEARVPRDDPALELRQAYTAGNDRLAQELAERYLAEDPNNKEAVKVLARIHNRQKNWSAALDAWSRLCTLEPLNSEPPLQVSRIAVREKHWDDALKFAVLALNIDSIHHEALRIGLKCLMQMGKNEDAAVYAKRLLAANYTADIPEILKLVSTMFDKTHQVATALELASLACNSDPDNAEAVKLRARVLVTMQTDAMAAHLEGDVEAAAEVCRAILRALPRHDRAISILKDLVHPALIEARGAYKAQRFKQAVEGFAAVLAIDPNHAESVRALARLHGKNQDDALAEPLWERLEALSPADPEPALQIARIAVKRGDLEVAYRRFRLLEQASGPAAQESKASLEKLFVRILRAGIVKSREGALDEALRLAKLLSDQATPQDGLIELQARIALLSARAASTAFKTDDFAGAVIHAQRALFLQPDDERSLKVLARAGHKAQDYRAAQWAWQRLHDLNPKEVEALLHLSRYHMRFKEYDQAVDACNNLLAIAPGHEEANRILQTANEKSPGTAA